MARHADPHAKVDLLRAAEAVFVEHGLGAATVEEITRRAGRSKGSFYLHFATKEEAFRQLVETMLARVATLLESCKPPARGAQELPAETLARLLAHDVEMLELVWQNRGVVGLLLGGGGSADHRWMVDEFAERAREELVAWLRWGAETGFYRADLDVEVTSLVMAGAYDRVVREIVRLRQKPDLRAWAEALRSALLSGVAGRAARHVLDRQVSHRDRESARTARAVRTVAQPRRRSTS